MPMVYDLVEVAAVVETVVQAGAEQEMRRGALIKSEVVRDVVNDTGYYGAYKVPVT